MESPETGSRKGSLNSTSEEKRIVLDYDHRLARRAMFKLDIVVTFMLTVFYFLNFLDRSNIGNARISGLQKDLKMTDHQFSVALTITYVPYIAAELPSNLLLKKIGAKPMLCFYTLTWGIVTIFQGYAKSYGGLLAARFFLGLCEGGLLPGIILHISNFYRRRELQLRTTILFTATSLAGAFSGLLAAAIVKMNGRAGHAGWAWIFILEGIFTVFFAIVAYFVLPNSLDDAWALTEPERAAYKLALREDDNDQDVEMPFSWKDVWAACKAPQVLILIPCFFANGVTLYSLAYFTPTIVSVLGKYTPVRANLLSVPPYALSFVVNLIVAILGDRYRQRGLVVMASGLLAIIGFSLYLGSANRHTAYGSLFLQITGAYGTAPALSAWLPNNTWPHYKRATAIAFALTVVNSGGILSTWLNVGPPRYTKATRINLSFSVIIFTFAGFELAYLVWRNRQRRTLRKNITDDKSPVANDEDPRYVYVY